LQALAFYYLQMNVKNKLYKLIFLYGRNYTKIIVWAFQVKQQKTAIGIVGTGFIATGLAHLLLNSPDLTVSKMLTRRDPESIEGIPKSLFTNSINELIDNSDLIVECCGDPIHATEVISEIVKTNKQVLTVNSEFHVTTGSYFAKRGHFVSEADGDQPGCLARLKIEAEGMGFEPLAYVNLKGFLNPDPTIEDMKYWSEKQQLALDQVVSFTDGTKLQIEQAFVANGLGATIAEDGMIGATVDNLSDLDYLIHAAEKAGAPISEYLLCKGSPPWVLIVANNSEADRLPGYLPFSRLTTTNDNAYILLRNYHLVHLEVRNTIRNVLNGEGMLLNNSTNPQITVAAVAKHDMAPDDSILKGAGGFDVRGHAVQMIDHQNAVPICLLQKTPLIRNVERGQIITFDDVDLSASKALDCYQAILADCESLSH
jgi:predicted homoserine dehydrogenase-like protein